MIGYFGGKEPLEAQARNEIRRRFAIACGRRIGRSAMQEERGAADGQEAKGRESPHQNGALTRFLTRAIDRWCYLPI